MLQGEDIPDQPGVEHDKATLDVCRMDPSFKEFVSLWEKATQMRVWNTQKSREVLDREDLSEEAIEFEMRKIYENVQAKAEFLIKLEPAEFKKPAETSLAGLKRAPSYVGDKSERHVNLPHSRDQGVKE